MELEQKENVTDKENVTSDQEMEMEQKEKVTGNGNVSSDQNINESERKEENPSVFKLEARRNFSAILRQEVETRQPVVPSPAPPIIPSDPSGSQIVRIVNSKITSVANIKSTDSRNVINKPQLYIKTETLKATREDTNPVFTYNPIHVNADSLHCIDYSYMKESHVDQRNRNVLLNLTMENSEVYRCYLCPYFNVLPDMIAQHWVLVHLPQKVYGCPHCDQSFQTNFEVLCHLKLTHPLEDHRVMIKLSKHFKSRVSFDFKKEFYIKEKEEEEEEDKKITFKIKCHKCGLSCQSLIHLEEHLKQRHIRFKPFVCHFCYPPITFNKSDILESHIKKLHPEYDLLDKKSFISQNTYEIIIDISNTYFLVGLYLNCMNCPYKAISKEQMIFHLINRHDCPSKISCSCCKLPHNLTLTEIEVERVECRSCSSITKLNFIIPPCKGESDSLYCCTVCGTNLDSKLVMLRHLKYTHSNWKPFGCGYCSFKAVEKMKVKNHIFSVHPLMQEKLIESDEPQTNIKEVLLDMFEKMVKVIPNKKTPTKDVFECSLCIYTARNAQELFRHHRHKHNHQRPSLLNMQSDYYRCIVCNYRCLDRSCMSRHAKYKHIVTRPHSCPYCYYNNVEKTKVRLHVLYHHPRLPKLVRTNKLLVEKMSLEAKQFYVRVVVNKSPDIFYQNISNSSALSSQQDSSQLQEPIIVNPNEMLDEDNDITECCFSDEEKLQKDDFEYVLEDEDMMAELDEVMVDDVKKEKEGWVGVSIEDMSDPAERMVKEEVNGEINDEIISSNEDEMLGCDENKSDVGGINEDLEDKGMNKIENDKALELIKEEQWKIDPSDAIENASNKKVLEKCDSNQTDLVVKRMDEGNIEENSTMRAELNMEEGIKLTIKRMDKKTEEKKDENSAETNNQIVDQKTTFKIPKRKITILRKRKKVEKNHLTKICKSEEINMLSKSKDMKLDDGMDGRSDGSVDENINKDVDEKNNARLNEQMDEILNEKMYEILNEKMDTRISDQNDNSLGDQIDRNEGANARMIERIDIGMNERRIDEILDGRIDESEDEKRNRNVEEVKIGREVLEDPKISRMQPVVRLTRFKEFTESQYMSLEDN